MQVSAIGNPNFQGRRDRIDELISLDDNSVQKIAYLKTYSPQEEKKHRKITNGLFYASSDCGWFRCSIIYQRQI